MRAIAIRNLKYSLFTLIMGLTLQQSSVQAAGLIRQKISVMVSATAKTVIKPANWVANSQFYKKHPWLVKGVGIAVAGIATKKLFESYKLNKENKRLQSQHELEIARQHALVRAADRGQLGKVRQLLSDGVTVNVQDGGCTPLEAAARNGHLDVVRELLKNGVNKDCFRSKQALAYSARGSHLIVVEELLKFGIILGESNQYSFSDEQFDAIKKTVQAVQDKMGGKKVEPIIETGINAKDRGGNSALMLAVEQGNVSLVKNLIHMGAYVNIKNNAGDIPLFIAIEKNSVDLARALIDGGADINAINKDGDSALACAIDRGSVSVVQALVNTGRFDVNAKDRRGMPLLVLAISDSWARRSSENQKVLLVQILIRAGAQPDLAGYLGDTVLHAAVSKGLAPVVRVLINAGADLNARNLQGEAVLMIAIKGGNQQIIDMLMDAEGNKYRAGVRAALKATDLGTVHNNRRGTPVLDIVSGYLFA